MQAAIDNSVLRRVILAIEQTTHVGPVGVHPQTRLTDDLELGRFGRLRLAMCLEEAFDLELPNEALAQFVTVSDIVRYFARRYFRDIGAPSFVSA